MSECNDILSRIEDIGVAKEKLRVIMDHDILHDLRRDNPTWQSVDESAKLDSIRMQLSCLSDNLWDLWAVLNRDVVAES